MLVLVVKLSLVSQTVFILILELPILGIQEFTNFLISEFSNFPLT